MTIDDLDALLCAAVKRVATGSMEPGVGTAMATIAKTITTIRSTGDFERRLEDLEHVAGVGNVRRFGA
jgi:nitrogenase subunit NifH